MKKNLGFFLPLIPPTVKLSRRYSSASSIQLWPTLLFPLFHKTAQDTIKKTTIASIVEVREDKHKVETVCTFMCKENTKTNERTSIEKLLNLISWILTVKKKGWLTFDNYNYNTDIFLLVSLTVKKSKDETPLRWGLWYKFGFFKSHGNHLLNYFKFF